MAQRGARLDMPATEARYADLDPAPPTTAKRGTEIDNATRCSTMGETTPRA